MFNVHSADDLAEAFEAVLRSGAPSSYNIAPGEPVMVVRHARKAEERALETLRWGLVPYFAKDTRNAFRCINARAETVDTRPTYRAAFRKRRCLLVTSGFYEWRTEGKRKLPSAIAMADRKPFAIAGLWDAFRDPETDRWLHTCALVTTDANELVASIHHRMPAILPPEEHARWLGESDASYVELKRLLRPYPADAMQLWPVSTRVNSTRNNDPELLEPAPAHHATQLSLLDLEG